MLRDDLEAWDGRGGREAEGKDTRMHTADSLCCTAVTNTTL